MKRMSIFVLGSVFGLSLGLAVSLALQHPTMTNQKSLNEEYACKSNRGCGPIEKDQYGNIWRTKYFLAGLSKVEVDKKPDGYFVNMTLVGGGCIMFQTPTYSLKNSIAQIEVIAADLDSLHWSGDVKHTGPLCTADIRYETNWVFIKSDEILNRLIINGEMFEPKAFPFTWQSPKYSF